MTRAWTDDEVRDLVKNATQAGFSRYEAGTSWEVAFDSWVRREFDCYYKALPMVVRMIISEPFVHGWYEAEAQTRLPEDDYAFLLTLPERLSLPQAAMKFCSHGNAISVQMILEGSAFGTALQSTRFLQISALMTSADQGSVTAWHAILVDENVGLKLSPPSPSALVTAEDAVNILVKYLDEHASQVQGLAQRLSGAL